MKCQGRIMPIWGISGEFEMKFIFLYGENWVSFFFIVFPRRKQEKVLESNRVMCTGGETRLA
jgi:hypothetical protein